MKQLWLLFGVWVALSLPLEAARKKKAKPKKAPRAPQSALLSPISVKLKHPSPMPIIMVGKESETFFEVSLPEGKAALTVDFEITYEDFYGARKTAKLATLDLAPGVAQQVPLHETLKKKGWYLITPTLKTAAGESLNKPFTRLVHIKPVGNYANRPDDAFLFGMDIRIKGENSLWQIEVAKMLGVDVARGGAGWGRVLEDRDNPNWEMFDERFTQWNEHNIKVQYAFSFCPEWAVDPVARKRAEKIYVPRNKKAKPKPHFSRMHPKMDEWRRWVGMATQRIKEKNFDVDYFETWNEPDLFGFYMGSTDNYLALLKATHEEVHKNLPNAHVMTGGIATVNNHGGHKNNPDLIRRTIRDGKYDILNLHLHGPFEKFHGQVDGKVAGFLRGKTWPGMYFNETGYPARKGKHDRIEQAQQVVKKMTYAMSRGAVGFNWFSLFFSGHEWQYSMMYKDRTPFPAIASYNEMVSQLRGEKFAEQGDVGVGNWGFRFKKSGESTIVLWDETAFSPGLQIPIKVPSASTVAVRDVMGNGKDLPVKDGLVVVPVGKRVQFVAAQSDGVKLLPPLASFDHQPYGQPGQPLTVQARLTNPTATAQPVELSWSVPGADVVTSTVTVPANGELRPDLSLVMPTAEGRGMPVANLSFNFPKAGWQGKVALPIKAARVISAKSMQSRNADFLMQADTHVVNFNKADPNRSHLTWKGTNDLSARAWIALESGSLVAQVDVTDDKHVQNFTMSESYKGDGVQLGLRLPGQEGVWSIGVAKPKSGNLGAVAWEAPKGADVSYAKQVKVTLDTKPGFKRYLITMPLVGLNISEEDLRANAMRFNLIVNDDDGGDREGYVFIAPGLGDDKPDPNHWPAVIFE